MKSIAIAAAAVLVLSAPAGAQDAAKPCKPSRQAEAAPADQPGAQRATGAPQAERERQMANSAPCESSPPATR